MKPILFNTEMVKAILDGRKTVTRRIADINTEITCGDGTKDHEFVLDNFNPVHKPTGFVCRRCGFGVAPPHSRVPVGTSLFRPRYWPGDILYVRETWQYAYDADENDRIIEETGRYLYAADGPAPYNDWIMLDGTHRDSMPWRPSIHMPKEAARLFLRVKNVRVERLQDITVEQVAAEGIDNAVPRDDAEKLCNYCPLPDGSKGVHCYGGSVHMCEGSHCKDALEYWEEEFIGEFAGLWESTIKDKDIATDGWDANPWVWVNEFERCEKPKEPAYGK